MAKNKFKNGDLVTPINATLSAYYGVMKVVDVKDIDVSCRFRNSNLWFSEYELIKVK